MESMQTLEHGRGSHISKIQSFELLYKADKADEDVSRNSQDDAITYNV